MRRSKLFKLQRRRIFLGCEGESERGYGALLSRLVEQRHHLVHIDTVLLNGGDPLAIVNNGIQEHRRRSARGAYAAFFILLDTDTLGRSPERDRQIDALSADHGCRLLWQDPSHEALLLRHLPGGQDQRPTTSAVALEALQRLWPDYEKPMPAVRLGRRIDAAAVARVARDHDGLRALLQSIDFT